jgi:cytochrome c oxidase subunit IV
MTSHDRNDRHFPWRLWKAPAIAWLALIILFAITLGSAYVPLGAGNIAVNLVIAALMVGVLVIFLMDLQNAAVLTRIVALSGIFWTVLMFTLTFNDYLSRHY